MTHTEREWRDGQPEGTGLDQSTGLAEQVDQDDPLAEQVDQDDPLAEQVHEDDPLAEQVHEDDPLVEEVHDGPLVGKAHEPAGPAPAGDQERFMARWQEIQAGFVDEPRQAVQDADALVVDMMDRLARMLASERDQLESLGATGQVSTEDLRQGLRRYRTLYERLLAV